MIGLRSLVLNSNYLPISLLPIHSIPVEDAITRVFNGTCHIVFSYDRKILSQNLNMQWPSVIARNDNMKFKDSVRLRKEYLFYRDHGLCAYCERPITIAELTYDHVLPRNRGGVTSWENIVAACPRCNSLKSDSLPIGQWAPKLKPFKPTYHQLLNVRKKFPVIVDDENWLSFFPKWEGKIIVREPLLAI